MKKSIFYNLLFGMALLLGACSDGEKSPEGSDPKPPTPPATEEEIQLLSEGPFDIEVLELRSSMVNLFVAPENLQGYYWFGVITREYLASFGPLEDISSAISAYLASRLAEYPDVDPVELLERGDLLRDVIGLQPEMSIVVFACEADERGQITSPIKAIGLTTPPVTPSDNILNVEVSQVTATNAQLKITPSNNDPYVWMELPEELYLGKSNEELKAFLLKYYSSFFPLHTSRGELTHTFSDNLEPDLGYMILAFGYDGGMTTDLFTTTFRTLPAGDPSQTTFDFEINKLSSRSVDVTVIPSDPSVQYLAILAEESLLEEYGGVNSESFLTLINEQIDLAIRWGECEDRAEFAESYAHRGNTDINWYLTPGATHYMGAVALDREGNFATEAILEQVVAPEVELSNALVEARYSTYFDGSQLYELDPENYADYAGCAVLPISFVLNDEAAYAIYTILDPASLEGVSDDQLISLLLNGEYLDELTFFTQNRVDVLLDWEQEYILCMIAMDRNDYAGALVKQTISPLTLSGASSIDQYQILGHTLAAPRAPLACKCLFGTR